MKKSILVYRGGNPLMKALEDGLKDSGTDIVCLDMTDERTKMTYDKDGMDVTNPAKAKYMQELNSQYDAVFTDNTMYEKSLKSLENVVSVYSLLKRDMIEITKKVSEYFKGKGLDAVINSYGLKDHLSPSDDIVSRLEKMIGDEKSKEIKTKIEAMKYEPHGSYLAYLLGEVTNTKVLPIGDCVSNPFKYPMGSVIEKRLSEMNTDPEKTVVLVDHHVYHFDAKNFDKLQIYPVCQCCGGLEGHYLEKLQSEGFKIADANFKDKAYIPDILAKIRETTK